MSALRGLGAAAIVRAISDAAERWSDADFPPRVRATQAMMAHLRYSLPVVEYALDRLFFSLRAEALEAAIVDELGSLSALDGPVERPGRPAGYARGVDRVAILASDTTIGAALAPALYALCAKCDVVVWDRNDALASAFFASLVEERPQFAQAALARGWTGIADPPEIRDPGGAVSLDARELCDADVVVAFGSDAALRAIRRELRADARFIPVGQRVSIGFIDVTRIASRTRTALLDGIAADALLYDGDGSLSLQALFTVGDATTLETFTADLALACERVGVEFPPGPRAADGAPHAALGDAARGAAMIAYDPPRDAPPAFLPRVLPVFPLTDRSDVIAYVRAHALPVAALGVADPRAPDALALAEAVGAVRIARLGEMQAPPIGGHAGGASRIADFVRWIDIE